MGSEPFPPSNFRRLVLGCIDSYDSEQRRIFQFFSKSTRFAFFCTAQSQNLQIFRKFFRENFRISRIFAKIVLNFCEIAAKINKILTQICKHVQTSAKFDFGAVQKNANLVNSEKICKMRMLSLSEASIQPRTSLLKFT